MEVSMEVRRCFACGKEFKVASFSKQKYHSKSCEESGQIWAGQPNLLSAEESKIVKINVNDMPKIQNSGKKKKNDTFGDSFRSAKERQIRHGIKSATKKTENQKSPEKEIGEQETEKRLESIKGSIMPEEKTALEKSSMRDVSAVIQPTDLSTYSETLRTEELSSLSLIGESAKQLQLVMRQVVNKAEKQSNDLSSDDVRNITQVANSITGLMKVKVEALKLARSIMKDGQIR
jgi:hypothetical protein